MAVPKVCSCLYGIISDHFETSRCRLEKKIDCIIMLLLFLFSSSLVSEVCKNYDVSMFQPRKETPTELGSVAYCYIAMIISPAPTFLPAT